MNTINAMKVGLTAIGLIILSSCSQSYKNKDYSAPADHDEAGSQRTQSASVQSALQDSTATPANGYISSMIASYTGDTARKFIKTADMKFRVKNVYTATYAIEDIIKKNDGFVTSTILNSTINNKTVTTISEDSSVESTYFTVSNSMTLRVPSYKLDSTLRTIAKLINYLDYRIIKADDVEFDIMFNQFTMYRTQSHERRLTTDINKQGKKLQETSNAENVLNQLQEEADNAKIENLKLNDKIKFSTIDLEIYQRETIKRELIANEQNLRAYEPGFWFKVGAALKSGWEILEAILIFLANIWFLYLFALAGYFIYRILRKNK